MDELAVHLGTGWDVPICLSYHGMALVSHYFWGCSCPFIVKSPMLYLSIFEYRVLLLSQGSFMIEVLIGLIRYFSLPIHLNEVLVPT